MNNIATSQNKEENLLILYSQKILYNKSKIIKYLIILFAIINFALGIASRTIIEYKNYFLISIFVIICFSKHLQNSVSKLNNLASSTQELIDRRLFNFKIKSRHLNNHKVSELISVAKNLKDKYPKKYIDNITNTGNDDPNGVKDWYTNIPSNLSFNEAILKCQKQNIYWDKYLIKKYKNVLIVLSIFLVIIFLFFYLFQSVFNLILGIASSISIIDIIIKEFTSLRKFTSSNTTIDAIIDTIYNSKSIDTSTLEDLQFKIFARRQSGFNIPSIIHKINIKKIHHLYNRDN